MGLQYQIEFQVEPHQAVIAFTEVISGESLQFDGPENDKEQQPSWVKELFSVKGVAELYLGAYDFCVTKGVAFDWADIIPKILKTMAQEFGGGQIHQRRAAVQWQLDRRGRKVSNPAPADLLKVGLPARNSSRGIFQEPGPRDSSNN